MDDEGKKYPSLPPNYVTLAQLQDRWLKEQQRKQQEKEEEERKQRDKEEQDRKREEDQQNQKRRNQNRGRNNANTVPRRPLYGNNGSRAERGPGTVRVSERKRDEMRIGAIVVVDRDGERKADDLNRRMSKGEREPRAEEGQIGSSKQLLPENKAQGKIPVTVTDGNCAKEGSSEIRRNGKNMVMSGRAWDKKVPVDCSAEIGLKIADISLSGRKGGHGRPSGSMRGGGYRNYNGRPSGSMRGGGYRNYNRQFESFGGGYGNYNRQLESFNPSKREKLKDSNSVWVRKGDTSDINVA